MRRLPPARASGLRGRGVLTRQDLELKVLCSMIVGGTIQAILRTPMSLTLQR